MASEGVCGCKGVRNCFVCNRVAVLSKIESSQKFDTYWHCPSCCGIYEGDVGHTVGNPAHIDWCGLHTGHYEVRGILNGIYVEENFVTLEEEKDLVTIINKEEWKCSQSGRRKQVCFWYMPWRLFLVCWMFSREFQQQCGFDGL